MKIYFVLVSVFLFAGFALAQQQAIPLWPGKIPGAIDTLAKDTPTLVPFIADSNNNKGAAVIICPGGAYGFLAFDHEGIQIAKWFNSFGVSAFVLNYRMGGKGYPQPYPLMDAQRAIQSVRSNAAKWNINKDKIGIMGFSAGGHLAASAGTHFNKCIAEGYDSIGRYSCRPDFMILIYPVISMGKYAHKGTRNNLLGKKPDKKLVRFYSNELQVTHKTPPAFLMHTIDDSTALYQNSILFYEALKKNKVECEMHLYQTGEHGFGLAFNDNVLCTYTLLLRNWMMKNNFR